jgi:hypothetical protein
MDLNLFFTHDFFLIKIAEHLFELSPVIIKHFFTLIFLKIRQFS